MEVEIFWEYSRNQRRHTGWAGRIQTEYQIRSCTPYREYIRPEHGYDLYINEEKVAHGKTVKELKAAAQQHANDQQAERDGK